MQTRRLWRSKFRAAENAIILATTKSSSSRSHPSINLFMHFNNGSRFSLRLFFGLGLHIKIGLPRINRVRLPPNHRPFPLPCTILSAFFPRHALENSSCCDYPAIFTGCRRRHCAVGTGWGQWQWLRPADAVAILHSKKSLWNAKEKKKWIVSSKAGIQNNRMLIWLDFCL